LETGSFTLVLIAACGGSVVDHGNAGSTGQAGTSGTGGTGVGGSGGGPGGSAGTYGGGGVAGSVGTGIGGSGGTGAGGATGMGGSNGNGGSAGTAVGGSTGAGGAPPERCAMPWDAGPCRGIVSAWWHDPSTGLCTPVNYSGCAGNDNRFASRGECQAACRGGTPNFDACSDTSQCVLASPVCCGGCEPVNDRSFVALNSRFSNSYLPQCALTSCAACPPLPPGVMSASRYFVPTCESGECTVVDIRQTSVTLCQSTSDCVLRSGSHCCETCGGPGVIAVNRSANFSALVCGSLLLPCAACTPPAGYSALCSGGRCTVQEPPCTVEHPCAL
jgi:hypothetical protein